MSVWKVGSLSSEDVASTSISVEVLPTWSARESVRGMEERISMFFVVELKPLAETTTV